RRLRPAWMPAGGLAILASRPRAGVRGALAPAATSAFLLPRLAVDRNPIHLRHPSSGVVRTLPRLASDGDAPLFDMVAVAPDRRTAATWAERLRELAEVSSVTTVDALVPKGQDEKLFVLEDIELVMGPGFAELERAPFDAERLERALA